MIAAIVIERGVMEAIVTIGALLFAASLYSAYCWGRIRESEGK